MACAGQSLIIGHFVSQESGNDAGKQKHRELIGPQFREQAVVLINAALGASAAVKTSNATSYWWDLALGIKGPAFDFFLTRIDDSGTKPTMILWGQGEEDCHDIGINTSITDYKQRLEAIFSEFRLHYGDIPIFIQRIGRRAAFSNAGGVQAVRDVQQELIDENSWCFEAGEIYDQGLFDNVHLDDAGYLAAAERNALRFIAYKQNVDVSAASGPKIISATRAGTLVTVTLSHTLGTDITPTANIEGFKFFDNGSEIAITAANRVSASSISLTLAATPSGVNETLYYGYDDLAGINISNIVRDNSAYALPLQSHKTTL